MNPILQAKAHDNVLELRCEAATNMKFDASVGDYCITTDQPYNGTTCEYDGDGYTLRITVCAGRKASADVAEWFCGKVNNRHHCMIATQNHGDRPDELNFAVLGALTLTVGSDTFSVNLVIAQGCTGFYNNWWLASKQMYAMKPDIKLLDERGLIPCSLSQKGLDLLIVREDKQNSFTIKHVSNNKKV